MSTIQAKLDTFEAQHRLGYVRRFVLWYEQRYDRMAERGAIWLDEFHPGWETLIDGNILRISSADTCVCAQLFYQGVLRSKMAWSYPFMRHRGFLADRGRECRKLTAAWRREIAIRRAA